MFDWRIVFPESTTTICKLSWRILAEKTTLMREIKRMAMGLKQVPVGEVR